MTGIRRAATTEIPAIDAGEGIVAMGCTLAELRAFLLTVKSYPGDSEVEFGVLTSKDGFILAMNVFEPEKSSSKAPISSSKEAAAPVAPYRGRAVK